MKKIFIYGTGSSCETYIKEKCSKYKILGFYESSPIKKKFHNLPLEKFTEIEDYNFDYLVIASMYYPEILDKILKTNFPISKIKIAISHKDDPRFGILMIDPVKVSENLDKYEIFKTEVDALKNHIYSRCSKVFDNRFQHLEYCFNQSPQSGFNLEFGVYKGQSLEYLSSLTDVPIWGFDSFSGPQNESVWNLRGEKNTQKAISSFIQKYKYIVEGYFEKTLPGWIKKNDVRDISFVHYDAGDYDSASYVMKTILPLMKNKSILVFDELIPSPTELELSEYRAFTENYSDEFEIISISGHSVGIKILRDE